MAPPPFLAALLQRFRAPEPPPTADATAPAVDPLEKEAYARLLAGAEAAQAREWERAAEEFQAAFINYKRVDDNASAALVQKIIGLILDHISTPEKARAAYSAARRLLANSGMKDEEVRLTWRAAELELRWRGYTHAHTLLKEAVALAGQINDLESLVESRLLYARLEQARGRSAEARGHITEAKKAAAKLGDPETEERVQMMSGEILRG